MSATLLLCSGGSALEFLETIPSNTFGEELTIGVLDERYSHDPLVNNFAQFMKTKFFAKATVSGASCIDTRVREGETRDGLASRFEEALRDWKRIHPNGRVVAILGIGVDGHTDGIMPMPDDPERFAKLFEDPARWVVGYDAEERSRFRDRVTVTLPFLREQLDRTILFAKHEGKEEAMRALEAVVGSVVATPARVVREMRCVERHLLG